MSLKNKIKRRRVALVVLDGWGYRKGRHGNAIKQASTPFFDALWNYYPHSLLTAAGVKVGQLPRAQGNSETGHSNLGAGRIVTQDLARVSMAIQDRSFFKNSVLIKSIQHVKKNGSRLHLISLIGNGEVHSSDDHVAAILLLAHQHGLKDIFIHGIADGRDTPPMSGRRLFKKFARRIQKIGVGKIVTVMGRYYAMDRDKRWLRTKKAYESLTLGSTRFAQSVDSAISASYRRNVSDEFILPIIIGESEQSRVRDNDAVIFCNTRPDRARQLTHAFVDKKFVSFKRKVILKNLKFVTMVEYDPALPVTVAFPVTQYASCLPEVFSRYGLKQMHIAETEKYAHVTYFFSNGNSRPYKGEQWKLVPSPKVARYTVSPAMRAGRITCEAIKAMATNNYDFLLMNYANADMLGHTGDLGTAIYSIEFLDRQLKLLLADVARSEYNVIITADHGNAEEMTQSTKGEIKTSHTVNPVPFILVSNQARRLRKRGILADVAPTILELMNIPKPKLMTGQSLILS